jgi:hypothetical protein
MIDLRNVLKAPYLKFSFLLIILLLSVLTIISPFISFISLILILFLSIGLISAHLISPLKEYSLKNIIIIFEFSLIYFIASVIFFIIQGIFVLVFSIPIFLLRNTIDVNNIFAFNSGLFIIILFSIIVIIGFLIIEFTKNIGFIRYIKSNKFEDFFEFKQNLKVIFKKDFLIGLLFLIGYMFLIFLITFVLLVFLSLIFPTLSDYFIGIFVIIFLYLIISGMIVTFYEIYKAYK